MITTQSRRRSQIAARHGLHFLDALRMLAEGRDV
jgi:hypothetical protein